MKKIIFFACLLFAFNIHAQTSELNQPIPLNPNVRYGKLPNGLTYYILANKKPEHRAELRLVVNAGSVLENDSQQGLAHLCEHMCFDGSKNFPKTAIIDYLERVGMGFGADLNAYTSFDETVYMLKIPTDTESIFLKGFDILQDWSHNVSFIDTQIDKERKVVIEEWRLGQGADERMRRVYYPVLYKDSRYAERLPIGKKDIVENAPYDTLKKFYHDWYRPDLQAIVAVGDFNVDEVEKLIKEKFSKFENPKNERPRVRFDVPYQKELLTSVCSDKEASYSEIIMMHRLPAETEKTVNDYRNNIIYNIYSSMLNDRLAELSRQANSPFNYAYGGYEPSSLSKSDFVNVAVCSETNMETALRTVLTENQRLKKYGFTSSELERAKKAVMVDYQNAYDEKDKTESRNLVSEYVQLFLNFSPSPGIEWEYNTVKKYVDGITLEELNKLPSKWIADNGESTVIVVTSPEKDGVKKLTDEEIKKIYKDVQTSNISAYNDKTIDKPFVNKEPQAGKVTGWKKWKDLNITEWTLSNGAKVVVKPTELKNDEIKLTAFSWGGSSIYENKDYHNAASSDDFIGASGVGDYDQTNLEKYLKDKTAEIKVNVGDLSETISGGSNKKDLETMLQLVYLNATSPRRDSSTYSSVKEHTLSFISNQMNSPQGVFRDTISRIMGSYNYRSMPTTVQDVNNLDLEKMYRIYKERFSNAGDFVFTFVGSIDTAALKPLVEKYIGGIPSNGVHEKFVDRNIETPKGKIIKKVYKGSEPKCSVYIRFTGKAAYSRDEVIKTQALSELLNIKLRETMRQAMSGVYGVGTNTSLSHYPKEIFSSVIVFGCAPENVDTLIGAGYAVINNVIQNGCNEEDLLKVKEQMKKSRETNMQENGFWTSYIQSCYMNNYDIAGIDEYNKVVDKLTSDDFKKLAAKYFDKQNLAQFVLYPEKK